MRPPEAGWAVPIPGNLHNLGEWWTFIDCVAQGLTWAVSDEP